MSLQQAFKFTDTDLQANKNGVLSPAQVQRYQHFQKHIHRAARCGWIGLGSSLALGLGMFLWPLYMVVIQQGHTDALPAFGIALVVLVIVLGYAVWQSFKYQQRTNRSIDQQRVHIIEGTISPIYVDEMIHGIEVQEIAILPDDGLWSKKILDVIEPHTLYRVYYLPVGTGNILLSLEIIT